MLLSGCGVLPWPHSGYTTPPVEGTLRDGPNALRDVPVRIATGVAKDPCEGQTSDSQTGAGGTFTISPIKNFQFFAVPMAHTVFTWHLCYLEHDRWIRLSTGRTYTLVDTGPSSVETRRCNIAQPGDDKC